MRRATKKKGTTMPGGRFQQRSGGIRIPSRAVRIRKKNSQKQARKIQRKKAK